jgi:F-type H+-transporting ATPase subunit a
MDGGFGPTVVFEVAGIQVTETVTVTWFIMAVLIIFSILVTRNLKKVPGPVQSIVETVVEAVNNLTAQTMGDDKMGFAPYMGTLLIFLAIANLIGLLGMRPPTADVNTTMSLAIITFVLIHINGARSKGIGGYLKSFTEPLPPLLPLNIIGELANPISLGFRLFGNIVGGLVIMSLVYGGLASLSTALLGPSAPPILSAGVPAVLHVYFDMFAGVLQSFIFTMLTMVYIAMAMD